MPVPSSHLLTPLWRNSPTSTSNSPSLSSPLSPPTPYLVSSYADGGKYAGGIRSQGRDTSSAPLPHAPNPPLLPYPISSDADVSKYATGVVPPARFHDASHAAAPPPTSPSSPLTRSTPVQFKHELLPEDWSAAHEIHTRVLLQSTSSQRWLIYCDGYVQVHIFFNPKFKSVRPARTV